jgi:energy-converting hydrogenase Eha subunit E
MNTTELSTALPFLLALASAGISTWLARVLNKKLKTLGHSVEKPWRWWVHVLVFIAFVNVLMLLHFFAVGAFLPALLGGPIALAVNRARWPMELRRSSHLAVGALSIAWLALGAYELALRGWKETVSGAPIRVDLVYLFGPLLYYSSLKAYKAYSSALKSRTNT